MVGYMKPSRLQALAVLSAIVVSFFFSQTLVAQDAKQASAGLAGVMGALSGKDKEAPTLMGRFEALPESLPSIAIVPFSAASYLGPQFAEQAQAVFVKTVIDHKAYRPYSLRDWMTTSFGKSRADSYRDVARAAKTQRLPAKFIITGKLFKVGRRYVLRISRYPTDSSTDPDYFMRSFSDTNDMKIKMRTLVGEMVQRPRLETEKSPFKQRITINKLKTEYISSSRLANGEYYFNNVPFMRRDGLDYKPDDDFISDFLAYSLHVSRLADVSFPEAPDYVTNANKPGDYTVSMSLTVTKPISILKISLFDSDSSRKIYSYDYTFRSFSHDGLAREMREAARRILITITSDNEKLLVGTSTYSRQPGLDIYCEGYYMGSSMVKQMLPNGLNTLSFHPWDWSGKQGAQSGIFAPLGLVIDPFGKPFKMKNSEIQYLNALKMRSVGGSR